MRDYPSCDSAVRRASLSDLDAAVETLVASHQDYIWERWALGASDRIERLRLVYAADVGRVGIPHGEVWMSDDGCSVAVWLHRDAQAVIRPDDVDHLDRVAAAVFGDRLHLIEEVERMIGERRPRGDWHLSTMGTRPTRQRRGLGSAVLGPRLAALDTEKETATLETSEVSNVEFYGRLGFQVVACLDDLPHGAPVTWVMVREPQ